jgi:hypothetical protein
MSEEVKKCRVQSEEVNELGFTQLTSFCRDKACLVRLRFDPICVSLMSEPMKPSG